MTPIIIILVVILIDSIKNYNKYCYLGNHECQSSYKYDQPNDKYGHLDDNYGHLGDRYGYLGDNYGHLNIFANPTWI